jgi:hypothetical protein
MADVVFAHVGGWLAVQRFHVLNEFKAFAEERLADSAVCEE